jgi:5-(carboxyamino)imidazole ribonucleotide synthase
MLPSKTSIGIIGGGQLGKMLIEAGQPWNIHYTILEIDNAPAKAIANHHIVGSLQDAEKIKALALQSDVITYEIEHINTEALLELEAQGHKIIPSPKILSIIQDKGLQKTFFKANDIPSSPFELVDNASEWASKLPALKGQKIAAKLRKGGYDGKGVELVNKTDIEQTGKVPFDGPVVLEEFVENAIELSVIVARNEQGEMCSFPTVEMAFDPKANLVDILFAPANISEQIDQTAKAIAQKCIECLNGVGIFAVEMFLSQDGQILVNEIAPRPHNSGHHTIEACYTSQYEQLNRILLGMPLGDTSLIQAAAMMNILGFESVNGPYELTGLDHILPMPGVFVHLYNKAETKPMRKMGHITIMGENLEAVLDKLKIIKQNLGMRPASQNA